MEINKLKKELSNQWNLKKEKRDYKEIKRLHIQINEWKESLKNK